MSLRPKAKADVLNSGMARPREQPGYYPGYSTLAQQAYWDEATRNAVISRLTSIPPIRFFSAEQSVLMQAIIDRIIPQQDRTQERRIPVLAFIDERLFKNAISGFRYEDMPPDRAAYHLGACPKIELGSDSLNQFSRFDDV